MQYFWQRTFVPKNILELNWTKLKYNGIISLAEEIVRWFTIESVILIPLMQVYNEKEQEGQEDMQI